MNNVYKVEYRGPDSYNQSHRYIFKPPCHGIIDISEEGNRVLSSMVQDSVDNGRTALYSVSNDKASVLNIIQKLVGPNPCHKTALLNKNHACALIRLVSLNVLDNCIFEITDEN